MRRPCTRAESLDAAALALALCAAGWLDELRASLVLAQHCWLFRSDGADARCLANTLVPALTALPDDQVPQACARWLARRGEPAATALAIVVPRLRIRL